MSDPPPAVPERFLVAKATLRLDRFMTFAIRAGGLAVIVAVFGIFLFLFSQVVPLFRDGKVRESDTIDLHASAPSGIFGIDEWGELPFHYDGGPDVRFVSATGEVLTLPAGIPDGAGITALSYNPSQNTVVAGTADGRIGTFRIDYSADHTDSSRKIVPAVIPGEFHEIGPARAPLTAVAAGQSGDTTVLAAITGTDDRPELRAIRIQRKRSLMGSGKPEKTGDFDLTPLLGGPPAILRVPHTADSVLVATETGEVDYLFLSGPEAAKRQAFRPFPAPDGAASMDFVFGDVSLVFTNRPGRMTVWSLLVPDGGSQRVFVETKSLPDLGGPATFFAASQRNKSFVTGTGSRISLRHSTTARVRWEGDAGFAVAGATMDPKGNAFLLLDGGGRLHRYAVDDPHPEAGWDAWFGKVWYEGASEPSLTWQSTGGTDDFEPKLSLRPLIFGTLKGTVWAMIFAVPVALLAAIYTAQFLRPEVKRIVKPMMEIMASLPSVVLGFLAALWLAPLLAPRMPSVFLVLAGVPAMAVLAGSLWSRLPPRSRSLIPPGAEWLVLVPLTLAAAWLLWQLGPVVERVFFIVRDASGNPLIDSATGQPVADFRHWWPQATGTPINQRNSLIVGMAMGFAVIPVIFTIAEDAISNVPSSLTAASAALGASRWQTLRSIVLPIAGSGIFSALMIGLGRAVGETMIVVMATGNTPVMDWNPFSGMRTLAANIATELPEAPVHSTLYRTLFLSALVLFAMTFLINTVAEVLRHRLREKYKLV